MVEIIHPHFVDEKMEISLTWRRCPQGAKRPSGRYTGPADHLPAGFQVPGGFVWLVEQIEQPGRVNKHLHNAHTRR